MWNLRRLVRSRLRAGQDFADEIESHVALEAERLVAEGWANAAATLEARRRFGNVGAARERFRDARVIPALDATFQDIRYCVRVLRRAPAFTIVAVLSLALGIGANTAIFTFVNAALLKPLPAPNADRLVMVGPDPGMFEHIDYPTVVRFRAYPQLFDAVGAVRSVDRANIMIDGTPAGRAIVHLVTGDYFNVFGVRAAVGRTITMEDEHTPGAHAVVVISDVYWRSAFGGRRDVLGRAVTLNGVRYAVIGVAPPRFTGDEVGLPADLWIPVMMQAQVIPEMPPNALLSSRRYFRMLALLKPGMTIEQARHLAADVYRQIASAPADDHPPLAADELAKLEVKIVSERRGYTPAVEDKVEPMVVVWAVVALVLAIAYVNVAGLLLVRAAARERELSTRLALGASTGRVARLLLTEGALIGTAASLLGVGLAVLGTRWLQRVAAMGVQPIHLDLGADSRVLALTIVTSLAAIIVCGLVPARRVGTIPVASGLKVARTGNARSMFGRVLVVAQVALAVTLVVAAGLFTRTLSALEQRDTGFDRDHLLEAATVPDQANIDRERLVNLYDAVMQRVGALPGVDAVAISARGLLAGTPSGAVNTTVVGYVRPKDEQPFVPYDYITPSFFHTSGLTLIAGRPFGPGDVPGGPRVAVVSASFARHFFGSVDAALGKRFWTARDSNATTEIVGIVRDVKDRSLRDEDVIMMYLPYRQEVRRVHWMSVLVRATGDPAALAPLVRRTLHDLDPALPILSVEPMRTQMRHTITMEWFTALASSFFGGVALLLAALGMFALAAQAVVRRTSEIGIRMALGGTAANVMRLIVGENLRLVLAGLVAGNVIAVFATHAIAARLYGVPPGDVRTFVAATAIMTAAALAATLLPARRATRIDPAISLRHE